MVTTHKRLIADVPATTGSAITLDTPYGFQENADELTERVQRYFLESVGRSIDAATLRSVTVPAATVASAIESLRRAHWVFAGPGSPSYALRVWRETGATTAFEAVLARGSVVFASAAALTAGAFTMPVYEIYKVGEDPKWLPGLDFLGHATGLRAAVIPHFDNAEGGTHDTRFCYVGERRLAVLESQLPEDCFVLGIDEHSGVQFDLDAQRVHVFGRGGMTVRMGGRMWVVPAGSEVSVAEVAERAGTRLRTSETPTPTGWDDTQVHSLLDEGRVQDAVDALLALDGVDRDASTRAAVHALILHLGQVAANPNVDIAGIVGPYIEALLAARASARSHGFWAEADEIRARLNDLRVTIIDRPEGSTWTIG
jgi:cyanophycinase-like exopeptidase